jgi:hypothetical protein
MSLMVSASQRCSVTVSRMVMGVGSGWCGPGVKGEAAVSWRGAGGAMMAELPGTSDRR